MFSHVCMYVCMYALLTGRPIFSEGMQPIMEEKGFTDTRVDIQVNYQ